MSKEPRLLLTNQEPVGEVYKSPSIKIKVSLAARDGIKYIQMREWYHTKRDDKWKASIKGLSIPLQLPFDFLPKGSDNHVLDAVLELVTKAIKQSDDFELDNPDNYVYSKGAK